jgi:hypothetical protein
VVHFAAILKVRDFRSRPKFRVFQKQYTSILWVHQQ